MVVRLNRPCSELILLGEVQILALVLVLFAFLANMGCTDPLTCTQNGVWMLGNLNTCRFLPLPGSEAKSSNLMMFKKSMSMIS